MLRCSLKFNPQSVIRYQQFALWVKCLIQFPSAIYLLLDSSLTVKAATLIFISGCGSAISSAEEETSGFIYNLVKS